MCKHRKAEWTLFSLQFSEWKIYSSLWLREFIGFLVKCRGRVLKDLNARSENLSIPKSFFSLATFYVVQAKKQNSCTKKQHENEKSMHVHIKSNFITIQPQKSVSISNLKRKSKKTISKMIHFKCDQFRYLSAVSIVLSITAVHSISIYLLICILVNNTS